jgi:hypothetical protein
VTGFLSIKYCGGEGGIRTLAALTNTNGLANRPLEPLGYFSCVVGILANQTQNLKLDSKIDVFYIMRE